AAAGEASDDVSGAANRRRRLVGARRGKTRDHGGEARPADAKNLVELSRAVAAPEEIEGVAQPDGRRVVERRREPSKGTPAADSGDLSEVARGIGCRQTAQQNCMCAVERRGGGVLDRRREVSSSGRDEDPLDGCPWPRG